MSDWKPLRDQIDEIDAQLVELLAQRADLVAQVWAMKQQSGAAQFDPQREAAMRDQLAWQAKARGLDPAAVLRVFATIIGQSFN